MARASKLGSSRVLIMGEQEISEGMLIEKDLASGKERKVPIPGGN
jgi:hypothetical protein